MKVVLSGVANCGKTAIFNRLTKKYFDPDALCTISLSSSTFEMETDNGIKTIKIDDTAGQERYSSMTQKYFRDADVILLVFDMNDNDSFVAIDNVYKSIEVNPHSFVIIGAKSDLEQKVPDESIRAYCVEKGFQIFKTSAKEDIGFSELIQHFVTLINDIDDKNPGNIELGKDNNDKKDKKSCC